MSRAQRLQELAALDAVGALDEAERAELASMIESDPGAAAVVRSFGEAGALLAESLPPLEPPADGLEALHEAIRAPSRLPRATASSSEPIAAPSEGEREPDRAGDVVSLAAFKRQRRLTIATACMGVAASALLAFLWSASSRELASTETKLAQEEARRQAAATSGALLMAENDELRLRMYQLQSQSEIVKSPNLRLASISSPAGATLKVLIAPDQRQWLVYAYHFPALPEDKDYQLWFVPGDGREPISGGVLTPAQDGSLGTATAVPEGLGDNLKAAVSIEPKGGSQHPTMDQVQLIGDTI